MNASISLLLDEIGARDAKVFDYRDDVDETPFDVSCVQELVDPEAVSLDPAVLYVADKAALASMTGGLWGMSVAFAGDMPAAEALAPAESCRVVCVPGYTSAGELLNALIGAGRAIDDLDARLIWASLEKDPLGAMLPIMAKYLHEPLLATDADDVLVAFAAPDGLEVTDEVFRHIVKHNCILADTPLYDSFLSSLPAGNVLRSTVPVVSVPDSDREYLNAMVLREGEPLINIIMTMFCAFPLSRKEFTARNKLSAYFVFTMYFSGGLVPTYILVMKLGLINSPWAMIIPTAMSTYNMIIARTYMVNSIPDELYEATEIDGGTPWQYFIKIVWPLCKPIIAVLVLYYGVAKWNDYYNAMIFLKKDSLQPLTIVMRDILIQNQVDPTMLTDARQASELAGLTQLLKYSTIVVASLPVLIMYPFVQKYFVKGVMIGAVKG